MANQLDDILQGLEDSEVLSNSLLREAARRLQDEGQKMKQAVLNFGRVAFQDDEPCDESAVRLEASLCVLAASGDTKMNKSLQLLREYRSTQSDLKKLKLAENAKRISADLESKLLMLNKHVDEGRYADAGWCVLDLQKTLLKNGINKAAEPADIPEDLRKFANRVNQERQNLLESIHHKLQSQVKMDAESQQICVSPGLTNEIWRGLEVVGDLGISVSHLAKDMYTLILEPLLASSSNSISVSVTSSPMITCHWKRSSGTEDLSFKIASKLSAIEAILRFVAEHLFLGIGSLMDSVGETIWEDLEHNIVDKVSDQVADIDAGAALELLETVVTAACSLEETAQTLGCSCVEQASLQYSLSNIGMNFLKTFPLPYLSNTRSLLKSPNWESVEIGHPFILDQNWLAHQMEGHLDDWEIDDPASGLDFEKSVLGRGTQKISQTAAQVLEILNNIMSAVSNTGSSMICRSLCQAMRDVVLLYSTMIPQLHSEQLQVPQISMLFYNDCQYLGDQLLLIPHTVTAKHGIMSKDGPLTFVNEALMLRSTAEKEMNKQVLRQRDAYHEVLEQANLFIGIKTGQQGIAMRRSAMQLNVLASRLGKVMEDVMPIMDRVCLASLIVEEVTSKILSSTMNQSDISAQESAELPKILRPVLKEIPSSILALPQEQVDRFTMKIPLSPDEISSTPGIDLSWVMWKTFIDHCPSLLKLEKLIEMFDARLSTIVQWWEMDEMQKAGFTATEVQRLIWALFEHSDFREECIQRIVGI